MITGVDFTRTHEVIEMLDEIYDSVEEGCKDRCYIKGSCAESVKWVLEQACEYLRIYALTSTTQLVEMNKDVNVSEVIDMMKTKLSGIYGKAALEAGKEEAGEDSLKNT